MAGDEYRYDCQHCGSLLRECDLPQGKIEGAHCDLCPNCGRGPLKQVRQLALPFKVRIKPALA